MTRLVPHFLRARLLPILLTLLTLFAATVTGRAQTPWKFVVIGDTRGTSTSDQINTTVLTELADQIVYHAPVFVIASGDLVNTGDYTAFQNWRKIMDPVYQKGIKVYPVIGNHDAADVGAFIQTFGSDLPDNGPVGEENRTYAFTCDNVLILGLDTYVNAGRVNQPWINSVLSANPLPHVFAFGHMPAFKASHTDCLDDYPSQRDAFWASLRNAGGRAYFCGHDHFYDHAQIDDGDADPDNDVHQFIVGGGGAPLTGGYAYDGVNDSWTPVNIYHEMQYGYMVVEVNGPAVTMTYFHRTGANTYVATSEAWSYSVSTGPTPPLPPTGLSATAGDGQVALAWQPSNGATSYNVQRATGSPGATYTTIATGVGTTSYVDTGVVNGTTYYYTVTAVNDVGESASSAYIGATPKAPLSVPAAPTNLKATSDRKGQVKLTWTTSAGATSYTVKRSLTSGTGYSVVKTGVTAASYTDNKASSGTIYYYVVSAVNAAGPSPNSAEVQVTTR